MLNIKRKFRHLNYIGTFKKHMSYVTHSSNYNKKMKKYVQFLYNISITKQQVINTHDQFQKQRDISILTVFFAYI
jgi:hypothetical protein